jgi:hypothetical protein
MPDLDLIKQGEQGVRGLGWGERQLQLHRSGTSWAPTAMVGVLCGRYLLAVA